MTLAVETKSGTKKFNFNWSDMEDNFTLSIEGMPVRLMPLYEEGADEGKTCFIPSQLSTLAASDPSLVLLSRL